MKRKVLPLLIGILSALVLSGCNNLVGFNESSDTGLPEISRAVTSGNSAGVYITEISDSARYQTEFVEIYNSTDSDIDLSGWTLEEERGDNTSSTTGSTISLSGTLQAKSFALIVRKDSQKSFENYFGVSLDSSVIYIKSGSLIINKSLQKFVLKNGSEIIDNLNQNFLSNIDSVAVRDDLSLFDDSAFTFLSANTSNATPGTLTAEQNDLFITTPPPPPAGPSGVYVTEISDSATYQAEYVEIYNSTGSDIDLNGWNLNEERGDSTSSTYTGTISLSGVLKANSFAIIARSYDRTSFESYFGLSLDPSVNYIQSGTLIINKTYQKFILDDGTDIVDNHSGNFLSNKGKVAVRTDITAFDDSSFTFLSASVSNATPGSLTAEQNSLFGGGNPVPAEAEIDVQYNSASIPDGASGYFIGSSTLNTPMDITFVITNSGETALNLTGASKVVVSGSSFTLKTDALTPVSTQTSFVVTFTPTAEGDVTGSISIDNDDSDESPYNFTITGTGITEATPPAALEIPVITDSAAVVEKLAYTFQYNETFEQADWVAYELTRDEVMGPTARKDSFKEDPDVATGSAQLSDYSGSGYDRGHLAPAADMKMSDATMSESFYMSNMSPQTAGLNRGKWASLESFARTWAYQNESVYIVTGPVLTKSSYPTIGANKVAVPEFYYKVVLDYTGPEIKAIGFIMPNETVAQTYEQCAMSIDDVEAFTGLDFYHQLPDSVESQLESQFDVTLWPFQIFSQSDYQ